MAGRSAVLNIKIVSDGSKASKGFDEAETRVQRFEQGMGRASTAAAGVLGGLGLLAAGAVDAASKLQQSSGAIESVFGDGADQIAAFGEQAVDTAALSQNAYQEMAAVIGAQLRNMGISTDELVPKTDELIRMGADLAATFGGSTTDAVEALGSALRGERDPIERYGVTINDARIQALLAEQGLDGLDGAARTAAEGAATLSLIAEQAAPYLGALGEETDTAAVSGQQAAAAWENASASLGEALLPYMTAAAEKLTELSDWMKENSGTAQALAIAFAVVAGTILLVNGLMMAYRAAMLIATAAQWLFNAALSANPIFLIALVIAGVIAAVVIMYNKFEWFRDLMDGIGSFLGSVFDGVMSAIDWIVDKLSWIGDAASWVGDLFSSPMQVQVSGGTTGGLMGAAAGMRGAPLMAGAGGGVVGSSAGSGPGGPGMIVNVTVNGALDAVGVGRQIEKVLRDYGRATGRQVALAGRA